MKMVVAVIRPERLQSVKDALSEASVRGITVTHVVGRGEQMGITFTNRVGSFTVDEIEKVKIEVVVDDPLADKVIDAILSAAYTGHPGDGRIFVLPVERSLKIREAGAPKAPESEPDGADVLPVSPSVPIERERFGVAHAEMREADPQVVVVEVGDAGHFQHLRLVVEVVGILVPLEEPCLRVHRRRCHPRRFEAGVLGIGDLGQGLPVGALVHLGIIRGPPEGHADAPSQPAVGLRLRGFGHPQPAAAYPVGLHQEVDLLEDESDVDPGHHVVPAVDADVVGSPPFHQRLDALGPHDVVFEGVVREALRTVDPSSDPVDILIIQRIWHIGAHAAPGIDRVLGFHDSTNAERR
jgi:nitrogen regulatory protein P-II 1